MTQLPQFLVAVVFWLYSVHPSVAKVIPNETEMENDVDPIRYLEQFGYITKQISQPDESSASPVPAVAAVRSSGELGAAVRRFQTMANLAVTGELDEQTKTMMRRPRCGSSDFQEAPSSIPIPLSSSNNRGIIPTQKYSPVMMMTDKWQKTELTYRVDRPSKSPRLQSGVESELVKAFNLWSAVCPLSFVRQRTTLREQQPDIGISFFRGEHGDEAPFDGPGKTLAHAFPPGAELSGDIHFDEDEDWRIGSVEGVDLYTVAAHELGHALGINHSSVQDSLMFPWYGGYNSNLQLHADDINAIQALYGKRNDRRHQKTPFSSVVNEKPDACCSDFDSVTTIRGEIFFFKDKWFWRRYTNWTIKEQPDVISRFWTQLPPEVQSIDVAYELPQDNRIIFVKGKRFYEFEGRRYLPGRTKGGRPLTDLGLPSDVSRIDSMFTWKGRTHVTTGSRHWIMRDPMIPKDPHRHRIVSASIHDSSASPLSNSLKFPRLPIRSAFAHPDGGVFVFGDGHYWRLADGDGDADVADAEDENGGGRMMMGDEDGRLTSHLWMDCSSESRGVHPSGYWEMTVAMVAAAVVARNIL